MSTLALEDLGPRMRRQLGLDGPCRCGGTRTGFVATIPVIEAGPAQASSSGSEEEAPGVSWLRTGLHRLRIPALQQPSAAAFKHQKDYR